MFRRRGMLFAPEGEPASGGGGGGAPAAAPVVPAVAATPPAAAVPPENDPNWLTPRLERERAAARKAERTALLKEIGVSDPAAAAKLVADEAKRIEAEKSLEIRATEGERALAAERLRVSELSGTVSAIATERLAGLTDGQRDAVKAIAGEDAAAQLKAIAALAPTWGTPTAAVTPTAVPAGTKPAAAAPPASGTAPPAAAAPAPGTTVVSQVDHKAEYTALKAKNPHAASLYLNKHSASIYPTST